MYLKENALGTWPVLLGGNQLYSMAYGTVLVAPWESVAPVIGHVTPKISGCGACLLYWLDGGEQGQSSLASRVQLGTIRDRLGTGRSLGASLSVSSSVCMCWKVRGQVGWA